MELESLTYFIKSELRTILLQKTFNTENVTHVLGLCQK